MALKVTRLLPITDGAAAVILASEEVANKYTDSPVWIEAQGSDRGQLTYPGGRTSLL